MNDAITLRPARPDDAAIAAVLLYSAYNHTQTTYPLPPDQENRFSAFLERFFRLEENRFSYQYIQVAEINGQVVGLILSFAGQDEERLNAAVGWSLEREAKADEWYIDGLAVLSNWGQQGIGTRLLQLVEQEAFKKGYTKIALNVAKENQAARNLYERLGYQVTGETTLYGRAYVRMTKLLESSNNRNSVS